MESVSGIPAPVSPDEAAAALADIDQQRRFLADQLGRYRWVHPVTGVVLGVAAASLVWRNDVLAVAVTVLYLISLVPLLGTPTRLGIVPRDSRSGLLLSAFACVFAFGTPQLAQVGPWWAPLPTGALAAVVVVLFGRWRLATIRSDLRRPPRVAAETSARTGFIDHIGRSELFTPLAALSMGGAVVALSTDIMAVSVAGLLIYWSGMAVVFLLQRRIAIVSPGRRPSRLGAPPSVAVMIAAPPVTLLFLQPGPWWPTIACAAVVSTATALIGQWQHTALRIPTPTAQ